MSTARGRPAPHTDLPPGTTRTQVLARSWPPWRPGMRYDTFDRSDPGPWVPESLRRSTRHRAA